MRFEWECPEDGCWSSTQDVCSSSDSPHPLGGAKTQVLVADRDSPDFIEVDGFLGTDPAADVPALDERPGAVDEPDEPHRSWKGTGSRRVRVELVLVVGDGPAGIFAVDDVKMEVDIVVAGEFLVREWLTVTVRRTVVGVVG
jgi:hypothetical protein